MIFVLDIGCVVLIGGLIGNLTYAYSQDMHRWTKRYFVTYVLTNAFVMSLLYLIYKIDAPAKWWNSIFITVPLALLGSFIGYLIAKKWAAKAVGSE